MLDIKFIRENLDLVKEGARKKCVTVDLDRLVSLDDERKKLQKSVEEKRAKQNAASEKIPQAPPEEKEKLIAEMSVIKEEFQKEEETLRAVLDEWRALMVMVPNVPDISVPEGDDDSANQEIRTWGEQKKFSFTPKSHTELMRAHNMVDFERGSKVAGFRGYYLTGDGARLTFAIWEFVRDHFSKKEYEPVITPSLVRKEPFIGTGYLPQSEEDLYKTQDDSYLAGTSEVAVMGYYMDEVLEKKDLPKKYLAFSPCFRREAGSHGKDTKGLVRVHEFFKFEQVVLCEASHEVSVKMHEELTENAESIMQALTLPYRVVVNCGGDLGLGQVKKYDIEAWVPSEETYRETHSASYFHDFQTRRLNIRYRDEDGTLRFAHSLNNTAAATPRLLVPIIENYQQEDGTITIPEVLRPYFGKDVIGK
ncbi:serine--tRNA ligase [Candidatus Kaiserbacteria bacterium CG10_big_fil_rev_8_21_14_0_10_49_17]|uniref:Serine--tRNA ligase n=1 Tax=Candidatus Kaiserbacteria bacterium CG10_big_fil_rev_8_21_14_0_10_49_17 TaxID=1974609 RepID=A0A2M6WFC1_9BACT|nr:MAG: serine--tRNA ligase [Candidatus Kaiserbacteria bacterium CG10_big_fil_rev_8_21_14_0_10_49_17]